MVGRGHTRTSNRVLCPGANRDDLLGVLVPSGGLEVDGGTAWFGLGRRFLVRVGRLASRFHRNTSFALGQKPRLFAAYSGHQIK
jgi:hypothetical protein